MPGIAWKRWNWLESALIPLVSAAMLTTWIATLNQRILDGALVFPRGVSYPAWLVLGLLLGASLLEHISPEGLWGRLLVASVGLLVVLAVLGWLFHFDWASPNAWAWQLILSFSDFNEGIPAPLWVTAVTALLWRQGMAMRWSDYSEFWRGFVAGILMFAVLMITFSHAQGGEADLSLLPTMGLFLLCGLVGLALLSVIETLAYERSRGAKTPAVNRYWLVALGTVILMILIGGWLAGQLFSPEIMAAILRGIGAVLELILRLVQIVLTPFLWAFFWVVERLLALLPRQQKKIEIQEAAKGMFDDLQKEQKTGAGLPQDLVNALRVLFVLVILAAILFLLIRSWRRHRARPANALDEEREFIWSKELLLGQLRQLFSRKGKRPPSPFLALTDLQDPRQVVRRSYQRLLGRARALGFPRSPGMTPLAYEERLRGLAPTEGKALRALTDAYVAARYGDDVPTADMVAGAERALERIEQALDQNSPSA